MRPTRVFIVSTLLTALFFSCKPDRMDIDTGKVTLPLVKFERLDRDLFSLNAGNIDAKTKELQNKYGGFYARYIYNIINNGGIADSLYSQSLLRFISDNDMRAAYADVQKEFPDNALKPLEEGLTEAVKRYKVFFPGRKTPARYTAYMSGFNYNVVYADSTIGVSLDMYLGAGSRFYKMLQWPQYQSHTMTRDYMLPDAVRGWMITEFDKGEAVNDLLNHMIFYGKIYYVAKALLPQVEDSMLIHYTIPQMNYCKEYEKNLWGYFVKDNKLYDHDLKIIAEYTNDGPFTGAISKECPPRIAMWIGWQVVRSYMDKNPDVSLEQLMREADAQKILSRSKYKP